MSALPAVILAGGLSTRMGGGNKALRMLAGETLLSRVIARLSPQCGRLAINANGEPEQFAEYGLPVIADGIGGFAGPLAGVLAGMEWAAAEGADSVVSVSVDTPFLPEDLVHRLREAAGRSGVAIAASPDDSGQLRDHPTCALWPVSLRGELHEALESGLHRIGQFAAAHDPGRAVFDSRPLDPFLNLNTPEDLARAARLV
ncbi:molybdenum cofactor guanylyltransferase MobA [Paracoccus versutus]|jgi:molybdopterin-guanine dinucleotide biosynthesis protein A|uniref:Molybdenum cofactor guanylyltransferase n=1 Tax=Paracoccus versutus TaxID=34007 RepID=A0AAQ0HKN2_PARVE|nr:MULTISPECIES: molybdenum cofactor guanylyltransferase MobA [Paracoccus]WGR60660.1 molybdenum cofactor guanylyltransferase MobA [Paracoccus ferrooxidans]KGJ10873.1 molybdopterin-guanine dinucleotide biosynthesis protein A [Paracoccus versutus]MBT0780278.1 molybdenum cofactor guanylyltransferase MobA [Paracoccus sp. pheM1]MCJ1899782.1 molybdenum cofactor guanylyltransferase MobA [Paracoccus versutus]MDF3904045.1 molybdenum cofactor guanylyltransferase MobA [Paracoccus sp. AS002]